MKSKISFIGDSNVGKTSIIQKYLKDNKSDTKFGPEIYVTQNDKIKYYVWDIPGWQKQKSFLNLYLKDSDLIILVFDKLHIHQLSYWLNYLNHQYYMIDVFLVQNKIDECVFTNLDDEVRDIIIKHDIRKYVECSTETDINIDFLFNEINKYIMKKYSISNNIVHNLEKDIIKKRNCAII